nr:hypothetical protein HEP84_46840 [Streptomyces sp. RLB1-33]
MRTIQKAVDEAKPGTVIAVRGSTYALTDTRGAPRPGGRSGRGQGESVLPLRKLFTATRPSARITMARLPCRRTAGRWDRRRAEPPTEWRSPRPAQGPEYR